MDKNDFLKNVCEMLSSKQRISMDTDLIDIEEWDSFSMMAFIAMVDEKYHTSIEPFSVAEAVLVEDLYYIVCKAVKGTTNNE